MSLTGQIGQHILASSSVWMAFGEFWIKNVQQMMGGKNGRQAERSRLDGWVGVEGSRLWVMLQAQGKKLHQGLQADKCCPQ